ncbi:hypothetical protein [Kitasatospora sp. LaBMicrA B282]|uniref:hypothetical protein n=1 Tax=Kitasatospora sp. LaBMicrA B282 TaxID=3420949 RepID=UPI003D0E239B
MAVIAVTGGLGAPGATTSALALLLCWPLAPGRKVLLAECDPDGGAALAGALEGRVEAVYGLRNLAVADRRGLLAESLWDQLIDISPDGAGNRLLLPGLTDPAQAAGLAYTWEPLAETLHALDHQGYDVLIDLGRSGATGPGAVLARRADAVVATVRTTLRGLSGARPRLAALREDLASGGTGADALGLLLIAEGPYPAADVTRELGLPVFGVLPFAARTARVLSDGGDSSDRRFVRSELMRTARTTADRIQQLVTERRDRLGRPGEPAPVALEAVASEAVAAPAAGYGGTDAQTVYGGPPPEESVAAAGTVGAAGPGWAAAPAGYQEYGYQQAYAAPSGQVFAPPEYWQDPAPDAPATMPPAAAAGQPGGAAQGYPPPASPVPGGWAPPVPTGYVDRAPAAPGHGQPYGQPAPEPPIPAHPAPVHPAPTQPAPARLAPGGQAFASPVGQVYVPQAGPVQVVPGPVLPGAVLPNPVVPNPVPPNPATPGPVAPAPVPPGRQPYPPLAGIAPHPAAPEPFRAPTEEAETQGEVLRAR